MIHRSKYGLFFFICIILGLPHTSFGKEYAYVDPDKVLAKSKAGEAGKNVLIRAANKWQDEVDSRLEELKRLKNEAERSPRNDTAKKAAEAKVLEYKNFKKEAQEDLQKRNDDITDFILDGLKREATEYLKETHYSAVCVLTAPTVDSMCLGSTLLAGSAGRAVPKEEADDVTDLLIERLNGHKEFVSAIEKKGASPTTSATLSPSIPSSPSPIVGVAGTGQPLQRQPIGGRSDTTVAASSLGQPLQLAPQDEGPSLEETLKWIKQKVDSLKEFAHWNTGGGARIVEWTTFDYDSKYIVRIKQKYDSSIDDFTCDMTSIDHSNNLLPTSLTVYFDKECKDVSGYIDLNNPDQGYPSTPKYSRSIDFDTGNPELAGKLVKAFNHAAEIFKKMPKKRSDDLF